MSGKVKDSNPLIPYAGSLVPASFKHLMLPDGVTFSYGCRGCEWKGTHMCPEGYAWGSTETLPEGICKERAVYLKGFYRGEINKPNFTQWEADYNQGVAQKQLQQILEKGENFRRRAEELSKKLVGRDDDGEITKELRKQHGKALRGHETEQAKWIQLWKNIRNFQEVRLTREAPKKLEVTHKDTISVSDFQNMLRNAKDTVDADYETIDDED